MASAEDHHVFSWRLFADLAKRVDLLFRSAVYLAHSGGADLHQVQQPLPILCLFRPVDVKGGSAKVFQALPQIDYL